MTTAALEAGRHVDSASAGEIVAHVVLGTIRAASNILTAPVFGGIVFGIGGLFGADGGLFGGFANGFAAGWDWTFGTIEGLITGLVFVAFGVVHAIRVGIARSYWSGLGVAAFILDHTWSLPNTIVGSLYATIMLWRGIHRQQSKGSGALYLTAAFDPNYDTTLGNVVAGTQVPKHEFVHVVQGWICGPFFYPLFIASYIVGTILPWWLIPFALGWPYGKGKIDSFGKFFLIGVYPYTPFELIAYQFEGWPPGYDYPPRR